MKYFKGKKACFYISTVVSDSCITSNVGLQCCLSLR